MNWVIKSNHWWWPFVGAMVILILDQLVKQWAIAELLSGPMAVLPFLTFRFICNTGAAFSILQGYTGFLTVVSVIFVLFFSWEIWRLRRLEQPQVLYALALSLILGGAAANLIDRAFRGCVVDYVHVHYDWFNFPVFNIADAAVCCGAACWILVLVFTKTEPQATETSSGSLRDRLFKRN